MRKKIRRTAILLLLLTAATIGACMIPIAPQGWRAERGPVVPHDTFPAECELCHVTGDWHTIRTSFTFDHAAETGWPLAGAHSGAECLLCHNDRGPAGVFAQRGCGGCHEDPHQGHLGKLCEACHVEESWLPREAIARHQSTRFPLTGAHALTACFACHPGAEAGNFQRADVACLSCHREDFLAARSPDHRALGWTQCEDCHRPTSFADVRFAHPDSFPLQGGHSGVACRGCHTSGRFDPLPTACETCHLEDFRATSEPDHEAAGFPMDCAGCHRVAGWERARFDHAAFELKGAHKATACAQCHVGGRYAGTPRDCFGCHESDYRGTTRPDHAAAGFSTDCASCHNSATFAGARFDHSAFELVGAHRAVDCAQCHVGGRYAGTPRDCLGCHDDDFRAVRQPDHVGGGFSANCVDCHNQSSWKGATFDHDATFALTGSHRAADCADCHRGGVFSGTPRNCVGCHDADFRAVKDPDHVAAGFSTDCSICHGTTTFSGATFDHSTFALTGAHRGADCASCHTGGVFAGTPRDCVGCHRADYDAARDPNHRSAGFPTSCESCHSTSTWQGAKFDHRFPITSGRHGGLDCADCHTNPSSFAQFSCIACHEHSRGETDKEHREVSGYAYQSQACVNCHPNGREEDAEDD